MAGETRKCQCGHAEVEHGMGGNPCLGDDLACGCEEFAPTPSVDFDTPLGEDEWYVRDMSAGPDGVPWILEATNSVKEAYTWSVEEFAAPLRRVRLVPREGTGRVTVTDEMVEAAARVMYPVEDQSVTRQLARRNLLRSALTAALAGGAA